jgi:deoxyribodipyrimidine photolyase
LPCFIRCGGLSLDELGLYSPPPRRRSTTTITSSSSSSSSIPSAADAVAPSPSEGAVVDWGAPIKAAWDPSERGALRLLDAFIGGGLQRYESQRAFADGRAVSRLSPYVHFGQISARLVWQRLKQAQ